MSWKVRRANAIRERCGVETKYSDYLSKETMLKVCELLRIEHEAETNAELRQVLRHYISGNTRTDGEFRSNEIARISRMLYYRTEFFNVCDMDAEEFCREHTDEVTVNGTTYEVARHAQGRDCGPEENYSGWDMLLFKGSRKRLMFLHDLNKNKCYYDADVVLEKAIDHGPYKRWAKEYYVRELS